MRSIQIELKAFFSAQQKKQSEAFGFFSNRLLFDAEKRLKKRESVRLFVKKCVPLHGESVLNRNIAAEIKHQTQVEICI